MVSDPYPIGMANPINPLPSDVGNNIPCNGKPFRDSNFYVCLLSIKNRWFRIETNLLFDSIVFFDVAAVVFDPNTFYWLDDEPF